MKLCVDCRFLLSSEHEYICLKIIKTNLVTGWKYGNSASNMRSSSVHCGPDGNWWEPKPPKQSFWKRLLG